MFIYDLKTHTNFNLTSNKKIRFDLIKQEGSHFCVVIIGT